VISTAAPKIESMFCLLVMLSLPVGHSSQEPCEFPWSRARGFAKKIGKTGHQPMSANLS
jgi:hypothetical protein